MLPENPTPTEPVTESTESVTEVASRKMRRLKMEILSVVMLVIGAVIAIDPNAVILVLGPESRGYVMIVFALLSFAMRRWGIPDPEPLWKKSTKTETKK